MNRDLLAIDLVGLEKRFGGSPVLEGLRFSIPAGQLVAIVGPSGCGKSTLLKLVAGLLSASAGEARLFGVRIADRSPDQLGVGMVFQDLALYPHFSVRKNLQVALRSQRLSRAEIHQRIVEVAAKLAIEALLDRYPSDLSGGEKQRVAIGRAIVRRPRILLLDEPLSQLDAHLRAHVRALIVELHQQISATTLYVTHDANEALEVADRVLVFNHGRVVQDAGPGEIYEDPASQWVAQFAGDPPMNFAHGTLCDNRVQLGRESTSAEAEIHVAITIGFRPSSVRVHQLGTGGSTVDAPHLETDLSFEGKLQRVYRREDRLVGIVESALGTFRFVTANKEICKQGTMVRMDVPVANVLLFDAQTGVRIRSRVDQFTVRLP